MSETFTLKNNKNLLDKVIITKQQCIKDCNCDNHEMSDLLKTNPNEKEKTVYKVLGITG